MRSQEGGLELKEDKDKEGSSCMTDHCRSHHRGLVSADPRDNYDFVVLCHYSSAR